MSWLVASGASIRIVQELARHSTPMLTVGRYSHTDSADMARAVRTVDDGNADARANAPQQFPQKAGHSVTPGAASPCGYVRMAKEDESVRNAGPIAKFCETVPQDGGGGRGI
ncbi:MAG: hypothetical protein IPH13_04665 [Planctomycetes bacterium]|nr:hypothetical protein [Planctomycetota bacterium]